MKQLEIVLFDAATAMRSSRNLDAGSRRFSRSARCGWRIAEHNRYLSSLNRSMIFIQTLYKTGSPRRAAGRTRLPGRHRQPVPGPTRPSTQNGRRSKLAGRRCHAVGIRQSGSDGPRSRPCRRAGRQGRPRRAPSPHSGRRARGRTRNIARPARSPCRPARRGCGSPARSA